jgi:hypothetical protein
MAKYTLALVNKKNELKMKNKKLNIIWIEPNTKAVLGKSKRLG